MLAVARLDRPFTAEDCRVEGGKTRAYVGCDGVMLVITDLEKRQRRKNIKEKRRKSGRKCRPQPPLKKRIVSAFGERTSESATSTARLGAAALRLGAPGDDFPSLRSGQWNIFQPLA